MYNFHNYTSLYLFIIFLSTLILFNSTNLSADSTLTTLYLSIKSKASLLNSSTDVLSLYLSFNVSNSSNIFTLSLTTEERIGVLFKIPFLNLDSFKISSPKII